MARRKTMRKSTRAPASKGKSTAKSIEFNRKAQWETFRTIQARADKAWKKFRSDVKRNARSDVLVQDQSDLLLLLGECNYMARECMRIANKGKRRRR